MSSSQPEEHRRQGRSSRDVTRGRSRGRTSTQSVLTFIDSQDPNSRSAIQRHTAHHSNAQRRESRLNSLRSDRPRLLEWQRRSSSEADGISLRSSLGEATSTSVSPAPGLRSNSATSVQGEQYRPMLPRQSSATSSDGHTRSVGSPLVVHGLDDRNNHREESTMSTPLMDIDEDDLNEICEQYLTKLRRCCPSPPEDQVHSLLTSILASDNSCCRCLLAAYMLAAPADTAASTEELDQADRYYGRGTQTLRHLLASPDTARSNKAIQAVLLLIAYAADTRSSAEVSIHLEALAVLTRQRIPASTVDHIVDDSIVRQMNALPRSRRGHLTLACSSCTTELRFPEGAFEFSANLGGNYASNQNYDVILSDQSLQPD